LNPFNFDFKKKEEVQRHLLDFQKDVKLQSPSGCLEEEVSELRQKMQP
jgi:hypothetical protein